MVAKDQVYLKRDRENRYRYFRSRGDSDTLYRIEVITPSGDAFALFTDTNSETVNDLAIKIRQWGGLDC